MISLNLVLNNIPGLSTYRASSLSRAHKMNVDKTKSTRNGFNVIKNSRKLRRFRIILCCGGTFLGLLGYHYICLYINIIRQASVQAPILEDNPISTKDYFDISDDKKALTVAENKHKMDTSKIEIIPYYRCDSKADVKRQSISIATQMSTNNPARFQRLLDLASRWDGYISVAIYTKMSETGYGKVSEAVDTFIDAHGSLFKDKVAIHLVIDKRFSKASEFYPNNLLRNIATEYSLTKLIINLDVDFIPSLNSHNQLLFHISKLKNHKRAVMMLPSFERQLADNEDWENVTSSDLPTTKTKLLKEMKSNPERVYSPFHHSFFPAGHGPTDFARWYKANDAYMINYKKNFEPYYVVLKTNKLPQFWEHFTGFGKNKLSWVEEMALAGYEFHVAPDCFLVHINHSHPNSEPKREVRKSILREYSNSFWPYLTDTYGKPYWNQETFASYSWKSLPNYAKNAATVLGFDKYSWSYGPDDIPIYRTPLLKLEDAELYAARFLGLEDYFYQPTPYP